MDYHNYSLHSVREAVFDEQQLANITIKNSIKDENIISELVHYRLPVFPSDVHDKISDIFSDSQDNKENNDIDNNLTFYQSNMDKHQDI